MTEWVSIDTRNDAKYFLRKNALGFYDVVWRQQGTIVYVGLTYKDAYEWAEAHEQQRTSEEG